MTDPIAPSGKRARLGPHSANLVNCGETRTTSIVNPDGLVSLESSTYSAIKVDSETVGDTGERAVQNQRPDLVAPAEHSSTTVVVSRRKNANTYVTAPTLTSSNSNSDSVTPVTKKLPNASKSTREKTDRFGTTHFGFCFFFLICQMHLQCSQIAFFTTALVISSERVYRFGKNTGLEPKWK